MDTEACKYEGCTSGVRAIPTGDDVGFLGSGVGERVQRYELRRGGVALDAYYVRNRSVWRDLVILARIVESIIFTASGLPVFFTDTPGMPWLRTS